MMLKSFRSSDPKLLCRAYTTYIRPLLEYASEVWSPCLVGQVNEIENVQRVFSRRLFRRCARAPNSYRERLKYFELETLESRRYIRDIKFIYKAYIGMYELDSSLLFKNVSESRQTRNSHPNRLMLPYIIKEHKRSTCASRILKGHHR